jgi:hypothetical protein
MALVCLHCIRLSLSRETGSVRCGACSLFNNILSPAELDDRASIFFFLDGIKPDWDEKETADGGVWTIPVKRSPDAKTKLESYWADVVRPSEESHRLFQCLLQCLGQHP